MGDRTPGPERPRPGVVHRAIRAGRVRLEDFAEVDRLREAG
ncbi:hypothetical protein [Nocardioides aurantiacus]|nr:hypothetical protein [Nocardioides aurantiacus]